MPIYYVVIEKRNPMAPEEPKKWYAQAKSITDINLRQLAKKIVQRCTVNAADTVAVLEALNQILVEELSEGKIVRFGDFGSFQVTLGSEGAETEKKFHVGMIKTLKIRFRPGIALRELLNNPTFEKYPSNKKEETETTE